MNFLADAVPRVVQPWAEVYAGSDVLQFAVHAAHIGGMVVAGGTALAADRLALRMRRRSPAERQRFLARLAKEHRRVATALAVVMASGIALLLAHWDPLFTSPWFWAKLALVAVLLWNGNVVRRAGRGLREAPEHPPGAWEPMEAAAGRSVGLWIAVALIGLILTAVD